MSFCAFDIPYEFKGNLQGSVPQILGLFISSSFRQELPYLSDFSDGKHPEFGALILKITKLSFEKTVEQSMILKIKNVYLLCKV